LIERLWETFIEVLPMVECRKIYGVVFKKKSNPVVIDPKPIGCFMPFHFNQVGDPRKRVN
jgi:hypothetical protein